MLWSFFSIVDYFPFTIFRSNGQTTRSYLPQGAADCHYLHRNNTNGAVAAISDCREGKLRGFVATKGNLTFVIRISKLF